MRMCTVGTTSTTVLFCWRDAHAAHAFRESQHSGFGSHSCRQRVRTHPGQRGEQSISSTFDSVSTSVQSCTRSALELRLARSREFSAAESRWHQSCGALVVGRQGGHCLEGPSHFYLHDTCLSLLPSFSPDGFLMPATRTMHCCPDTIHLQNALCNSCDAHRWRTRPLLCLGRGGVRLGAGGTICKLYQDFCPAAAEQARCRVQASPRTQTR